MNFAEALVESEHQCRNARGERDEWKARAQTAEGEVRRLRDELDQRPPYDPSKVDRP